MDIFLDLIEILVIINEKKKIFLEVIRRLIIGLGGKRWCYCFY